MIIVHKWWLHYIPRKLKQKQIFIWHFEEICTVAAKYDKRSCIEMFTFFQNWGNFLINSKVLFEDLKLELGTCNIFEKLNECVKSQLHFTQKVYSIRMYGDIRETILRIFQLVRNCFPSKFEKWNETLNCHMFHICETFRSTRSLSSYILEIWASS